MLQEMILQNRNHPSIILWGVHINESVDDDAFYNRTNKIRYTAQEMGRFFFCAAASAFYLLCPLHVPTVPFHLILPP